MLDTIGTQHIQWVCIREICAFPSETTDENTAGQTFL